MLVYTNTTDENILAFVNKLILMTSENELQWKKIRTDIPTYITTNSFMMKNRCFYATIQDSTLEYKIEVDYEKYSLKNNTNKVRKIPVLFQIKSHNSLYKINKLMKTLIRNIQKQIKFKNILDLEYETKKVNSFINSFLGKEEKCEEN